MTICHFKYKAFHQMTIQACDTVDSTFNRYLYRLLHSYCSHSWYSNIVLMLLHLYPVFPAYEQTTSTCTNVCVY